MSLESGNYIKDLVQTNPEGTDPKSQGDDHLRLLKQVLKSQFSGFTQGKAITKTEDQINAMLTAGAGAFGLGGAAINVTESVLVSADLPTGFYYAIASGLGFFPPGVAAAHFVVIDNSSAGYCSYLLINADTGPRLGECQTITKYNGVFGNWRCHTDQYNRPPQQHPFDTNSLSLLNPGSFGQCICQPAGANANINGYPFSQLMYNGRWWGNSWNAASCPAGESGNGAIVEWQAYAAEFGVQTFSSVSTGRKYRRTWMNTLNWTAWETEATVKSSNLSASGWQTVNGVMRQWGTAPSQAQGTTQNVPFNTAFAVCFGVQVNCPLFSAGNYYLTNVTTFNNVQFTIGYMANTPSPSGSLYWEATGTPP